jgi:hypothetical protein
MSNLSDFKYEIFWRKTTTSAFFKKPKESTLWLYSQNIGTVLKCIFLEVKGEKRACPGVPVTPRTTLMEQLIKKRQGEVTFVIFTSTVVGVVTVDTENTWTTLISKYDLLYTMEVITS